jgi:hypothetical protein
MTYGIPAYWESIRGSMRMMGGVDEQMEEGFREAMGMGLSSDLIPALGSELLFAVTHRAPVTGAPDEVVIPGVVFGLEVRDPAVVKRALDRALELIEESMGGDPAGGSLVAREVKDGVEVVSVALPPDAGIPLHPAMCLNDGLLLLSTDADVLRQCLDARSSRAPRKSESPAFTQSSATVSPRASAHFLVDWPLLVDQIQVYAPHIGRMVGGSDVPFPEYPESGDEEEWNRRLADYQAKQQAAQGTGGEKAKKWIDALRVIDWFAASGSAKGSLVEGVFMVKFSK